MEIKNKNLTCFVLFLDLPCREVKWKLFYDAKTKVDALTVSSRVSSLVINLLKLITNNETRDDNNDRARDTNGEMVACVASVSVRFRSKERGTRV